MGWLDPVHRDHTRSPKERMELATDCDYAPIQSEFYHKHKALVYKTRDLIGNILFFSFFILISMSCYINIEEGKFPFTVDFMADIAYGENKYLRNAYIALILGSIIGISVIYARRLIVRKTEGACFSKIYEHLEASGSLKKIRPVKPKRKNG